MNKWDIDSLERNFGSEVRASINVVNREELKDNEFVFTMSDEILDRHGTVVKLDGGDIEEYNRNPVVILMHQTSSWSDYDIDNVIGKGHAFYEDGLLKNKITFEPREINPKAGKVVDKINFGSLRAGSIGFIPHDGSYGKEERGESKDVYYIRKWTLIEYSVVTVPSNPNALVEKKNIEDTDIPKVLKTDVLAVPEKYQEEEGNEEVKAPLRDRADYRLRILKLRK